MATNYNNEFCVQCETFTYKGDGIRLEHNGSWRTFCATCAVARQINKNKAVTKAAYIKKQPKLFTEEVMTMKCDKNPLKTIKHHTWRSDYRPDNSIKEYCKWCGVNKKDLTTTNPEEGTTMKVEQTTFTMTEKQIAYIRDLFKSKKQFMTIDEQESLINKMMGHIDGSAVLTTKWASAAITKLKSYNTERSAS